MNPIGFKKKKVILCGKENIVKYFWANLAIFQDNKVLT